MVNQFPNSGHLSNMIQNVITKAKHNTCTPSNGGAILYPERS